MLKLSSKEIDSVLKISPEKRYKYFINRVADSGLLWAGYDSNWVTLQDENRYKLFPVWPNKEFAQLFFEKNSRNYLPKHIEVHDFIENFLIDLGEQNIAILVFPTPEKTGSTVCHQTLYNDLTQELSRIE